MRIKITILIALLLLLPVQRVAAQYTVPGTAPTHIKWSHIKGDHFHVIFPSEIDSLAREYLFTFESTRDATLTGLHIQPSRMPMVLQPYNMNSNGSVSWAPRHIELYTTPPGNILYAQDWMTQLAVHEGRHVGQFTHYTRGALFPFQILIGEQGYALSFPSTTQMEGDAVVHETDMTGAGRGRDPEFLKYYRAAFLAGDIRKYDNWRYGSYRHYTPNKYAFGYMIASNMRDRSGNYFAAGDLLQEKVHSWWRLFSQSHRSYIKASGTTARKNWREAVARNNTVWQWEYVMRAPYSQPEQVLKGRSKYYTEFNDPIPVEGSVYATMTGLPFERRLVRIDSLGKYHYLRPFATSTSALVKDGDHALLFSEIIPDPRWEQRSWSILRRYDTRTHSLKSLTRRTRYVNPSVAPDGTILAAEYKVQGGSDVVVLDHDGKLLERIPAPENGQIVNVVQAGEARFATVVTTQGEGIYRHDGTWTCVVAPQKRAIRDLRVAGRDTLYFVTDLDGLSNVYAYHTTTGELRRWVNAPYGAARPWYDPADGSLYFANYDHMGYLPVRLPAGKREDKAGSFDEPYINHLADNNAAQMAGHVVPRTAEEDSLLRRHIDSLETRHYSKILHGFHVHSWAPFYANVDRLMNDLGSLNLNNVLEFIAPGVTVLSQNDLGTLVGEVGYSYYRKHHGAHAYAKYTGLYPVLEASFDFNTRDRIRQEMSFLPGGTPMTKLDTLPRKPAWHLNARVSLPLHFSRGGWNTTFTTRVNYTLTNDAYQIASRGPVPRQESELTHALSGTLLIDSRVARATSRLTPRLGFGMELSGQTRIGMESVRKPIYAFRAYAYLPGLRAEDGLKISYFRQYQSPDGMLYSPDYNLVRRPYGYDNLILMDYHRLLAEYALPIYAGDVNGGFFFYLKRVILIPFVDMARDLQSPTLAEGAMSGFGPRNFLSYGARLLLNTYLFRIGSEFKIGIQYTRTYDSDKWGSIRFVLNTGL